MFNLIHSAHAVVDLSLPMLNDTTDLGAFISSLYTYAITIVGVCVFIQFIHGGVKYLLAAGSAARSGDAVKIMRNAVIGAILLFASYFILYVINPDLVQNTFNFNLGTPPATGSVVISNVQISSITGTTATVTWITDVLSNSGITVNGTDSGINASFTTNHTYDLTGLVPNSTYKVVVLSTSTDGSYTAKSPEYSFTSSGTPGGETLSISNVKAIPAKTMATIIWGTDKPSSSLIEYTGPDGVKKVMEGMGGATQHAVGLIGLSPGTQYTAVAVSVSSTGFQAKSAPIQFSTLSAGQ